MKKVGIKLFFLLIILIGFSCVPKKKFVEMQNGRMKAEKEVRDLTQSNNSLTERIATLIADFEIMKTELLESNAVKDQYIDSLNSLISGLTNSLTKQDESLAEKEFAFDFEKRRLSNSLNEHDKQIKQLESQLNVIQSELKIKTTEYDKMLFDRKVALDKITLLESEKKTADLNLLEMQGKLNQVNNEIAALKSEIIKKDETITRLENNMKLLKKELEK